MVDITNHSAFVPVLEEPCCTLMVEISLVSSWCLFPSPFLKQEFFFAIHFRNIYMPFCCAHLQSTRTLFLSLVRAAWNYLLPNGLQQLTPAQWCFALFIDSHSFCLMVCGCVTVTICVCEQDKDAPQRHKKDTKKKAATTRTPCTFELLVKWWPVDCTLIDLLFKG